MEATTEFEKIPRPSMEYERDPPCTSSQRGKIYRDAPGGEWADWELRDRYHATHLNSDQRKTAKEEIKSAWSMLPSIQSSPPKPKPFLLTEEDRELIREKVQKKEKYFASLLQRAEMYKPSSDISEEELIQEKKEAVNKFVDDFIRVYFKDDSPPHPFLVQWIGDLRASKISKSSNLVVPEVEKPL